MWYAATTNVDNEGLELHGEFGTREDAFEAAMDAAGGAEVAFALEGSVELPTRDYHGLPGKMSAACWPLAQVAAVQQWCQNRVENVVAHDFGGRLVLVFSKWNDDCGIGWERSSVTVWPDGRLDYGWHLGLVLPHSHQVVGGELVS